MIRSAVAIGTINFNGGGDFTINMAVAMRVLREVAVHTLHAHFKMNGSEMHRFVKFLGVGVGDGFVFFIEQRTLAVSLEYFAEIPAVPVIISELGVFQCGIKR